MLASARLIPIPQAHATADRCRLRGERLLKQHTQYFLLLISAGIIERGPDNLIIYIRRTMPHNAFCCRLRILHEILRTAIYEHVKDHS